MYCRTCGVENPEQAKYCRDCGNQLIDEKEYVQCHHCTTQNDAASVFCKQCGKRVVFDNNSLHRNTNYVIYRESIGIPYTTIIACSGTIAIFFVLILLTTNGVKSDTEFGICIIFFSVCICASSIYKYFVLKRITSVILGSSEFLLMENINYVSASKLYLTTNRLAYAKSNNKECIDYYFNDKDVAIKLWKFLGNPTGLIVCKKYERDFNIKLTRPEKWFDKIMELRRSQ